MMKKLLIEKRKKRLELTCIDVLTSQPFAYDLDDLERKVRGKNTKINSKFFFNIKE